MKSSNVYIKYMNKNIGIAAIVVMVIGSGYILYTGFSRSRMVEPSSTISTIKDTPLDDVSSERERNFEVLAAMPMSNGIVNTVDGVTFTIPSDWRVEDVSMQKTGITDGFYLYSPDYQAIERPENLIGDIQTVIKGIKITVSYDLQPVDSSISDPYKYIEFLSSFGSGSNVISTKHYLVNEIPLVLSRLHHSSNLSERDDSEWIGVKGRNGEKNIHIQFEYATTFDEAQQSILSILSNMKF